ncbi:MAG TPA: TolC family protein [Aquabacterium sp.]|nr:TolC family protein [Aquabacterium sp.]
MSERWARACLLAPCIAGSALAAGPHGQNLEQAIEAAQSVRLSVRIAAVELDAARARLAKARAQRYPTLDFSANVDRIDDNDDFTGISASVEIPPLGTSSQVTVTQTVPRYQTSASLVARYNAYTGGRVQAQLNHENLSLQVAELSHRLALQQVAVDVSFAYFKLRRACMLVSSASRQLRRAESVAAVAGDRVRNGRMAPIEERFAKLAEAEKQSAWRSRQEDLEGAYGRYRDAVQHTMPEEPGQEARCWFAGKVETDLDKARQLSDQALDARQDRLKVEAARELVFVQRAALRPQLSLYANYAGIGRSNSSLRDSLSNFSYRQSSVGVQLRFNLFDHGLASQQVSEAEAEARKQALRAELAASDREQQKRRRELNVRMTETRIDLLRSRMSLAKAQADMVRQQLAAGTVTASAAEERFEQEADARDEFDVAQVDAVLAQLAAMFPARNLPEP